MKRYIFSIAVVASLISCEKEDQPQVIEYTNYNDTTVSYTHPVELDLDKDGEMDFSASTLLLGTSVGDHLQFRIGSKERNRILLEEEEKPAMLDLDVQISKNDQPPYVWTPIGTAMIVERISPIDLSDTYWNGVWKEKQNKYLPIQLVKENGKVYNGWIRISFSNHANSRIIIHDAAVSRTEGREIRAGQKVRQ
jgi:hypothetical protein